MQDLERQRTSLAAATLCIWSYCGVAQAGSFNRDGSIAAHHSPVRWIWPPRQAGVRSAGVSVPRLPGSFGSALGRTWAGEPAGSVRATGCDAARSLPRPPELTRSTAMRAPNSAFFRNVAQSCAAIAQAWVLRSQKVVARSTVATAVV